MQIDIQNKDEVIKWLDSIKEGSGDATLLWNAVTPKIIEFINYELDPSRDAHKLWPRLNTKYLLWKIKHYHVSGMGYLTGEMQKAAGANAIKTYTPKSLKWELHGQMIEGNSKDHYDYSKVFNWGTHKGRYQKPRPLYEFTALRINNFLKMDVQKFNGGSRNSFTFQWLKKSLEKGQ